VQVGHNNATAALGVRTKLNSLTHAAKKQCAQLNSKAINATKAKTTNELGTKTAVQQPHIRKTTKKQTCHHSSRNSQQLSTDGTNFKHQRVGLALVTKNKLPQYHLLNVDICSFSNDPATSLSPLMHTVAPDRPAVKIKNQGLGQYGAEPHTLPFWQLCALKG